MKFSTLLILGLALISIIAIAEAQSPDDLFDNEHYFIVGHVYEPYTQDNEVILINTRTGESLKVTIQDCEHGMKEYLFNLANLHQGWNNKDEIIISYHNNSTSVIIDNSMVGIQVDLNAPEGYEPVSIIIGTILILASGGGYYYIKKKKNEDNENNVEIKGDEIIMDKEIQETQEPTTETGFKLYRDFGVRAWIATIVIFGYITSVIGCVYTNNMDALKQLSIAILPIVTVIVMFYFQSSATRDMLEKLQK